MVSIFFLPPKRTPFPFGEVDMHFFTDAYGFLSGLAADCVLFSRNNSTHRHTHTHTHRHTRESLGWKDDQKTKRMSAIQVIRTALHLFAMMAVLSSLATTILHRFDKQFNVNVGFYFFGQSQWKVNSMPEDSKSKCVHSLYATIGATTLLSLSIFTFRRFPITSIIGLSLIIFTFAFSVSNMQIGVHFYNESPGALFGGIQKWGVGATLHTACASILFIPLVALIVEKCVNRHRAKRAAAASLPLENDAVAAAYGAAGNTNNAALNYRISASPTSKAYGDAEGSSYAELTSDRLFRVPTPIIAIPLVCALGLAVAGSGAPQASRLNDLDYRRSWHFIVVSSDFYMRHLRNFLVCDEFYKKLLTGGVMAVVAGSFNFLSLMANLVVPKYPIVATALVTLGCGAAAGAATMATSLSTAAIDCGNTWKNQGKLDIDYGLWCLYGGIGFSVIAIVFGLFTCRHTGDAEDAEASERLLSQ